ncbi:2-keto-3-deoxygluconate permease [Propionibacteriaceae bacterium ES.041]|uniref:2-keto-3-deoxygluconate permease n=1 Tax=Enemella evansiae TaxID=2016499 RepID=UPI000B97A273|nr:2-keto-3-deoxygluconate permease [Enemella evansiae]OYO01041.1 2-keto-3-deoxygluconate permease [Enemella evansiae]PFG68211.1 2-keto-3-deoxygluconate permease [Propionibacteriaceae bacterium ES.041]
METTEKPRGDWITRIGIIPGALMIVPLFLGAIVNTWFPAFLNLGGFTTGLFKNGTATLLGLWFFCMGAQLNLRTTGPTLEKGFAILAGKAGIGILIGLLVAFWVPGGVLLGLTPLAIIAAMTNSNGALYAALTQQFGNHTDRGAVSVISVNDGPFITMIALGAAGLAQFPAKELLGSVLPIILGMILGNLSKSAREFLRGGETLLIPFMGFAVGRGIDFSSLVSSGLQGIVLGVATVVLSGPAAMLVLWLVHLAHRRPKPVRNVVAGAAEGTTAGNAIATPAAIALVDPAYKAIEAVATAQVAAATVTTALLAPFVVTAVVRWQTRRGVDPAIEEAYYAATDRRAFTRELETTARS